MCVFVCECVCWLLFPMAHAKSGAAVMISSFLRFYASAQF